MKDYDVHQINSRHMDGLALSTRRKREAGAWREKHGDRRSFDSLIYWRARAQRLIYDLRSWVMDGNRVHMARFRLEIVVMG